MGALEQASILDTGHGVAWKTLGLFTWMHSVEQTGLSFFGLLSYIVGRCMGYE